MRYALLLLALLTFGCASRQAADANARGVERAKRSDFRGAIKEFAYAVKAQPDSAKYHYNLARALGQSGYFDQAALEAKRALECDPAYADASSLLSWIGARMDDRQAAAVAAVSFN